MFILSFRHKWIGHGRANPQTNGEHQSFYETPSRHSHLVLGILGLVLCGPLGIAAWLMGSGDLKEMDAGAMDPAGRSNTNAGKICGIIATVLMAVGFLVGIMIFVFGFAAAGHAH
jgi:hypothetical protein